MVTIAVHESVLDELRAQVRPSAELVGIDDRGGGADLSGVSGVIRWELGEEGLRTVLDSAPELRWLHNPGAGVESLPLAELADRGIILTNAAGIFAIPIAEWVLVAMLDVVKSSHAYRTAQRERRWAADIPGGELYDKTLLVLGGGGIGREILVRAGAFGMHTVASNRSGRPVAGAERTVSADVWRDVLGEADFIVMALPLTGETVGLIGAEELAACKPGAWLLNVGRGASIDENALHAALTSGRLGGAALDAWAVEPLPTAHWAWSTPNVIVSPHASGNSEASGRRNLQLCGENIRRFAAGEELVNVVDLEAGY